MNSIKRNPIAILAYNRLDTLQKTIASLKRCKNVKDHVGFIFSDAPNYKKPDDKERVGAVREYLKQIEEEKIFKDTILVFSDTHLGCKEAVISGLNYVLKDNDAVIDIEDDIIVSRDFLDYMDEALNYYKYDYSIGSVTGFSFPIVSIENYLYPFFKLNRFCSWGFGTWADRWQMTDWDISDFDNLSDDKLAEFSLVGNDLPEMLINQVEMNIDTWDIQFAYSLFIRKMATVYPRQTMVKNIGRYGTHYSGQDIRQQELKEEYLKYDFSHCAFSDEIAREMKCIFVKEAISRAEVRAYNKDWRYKRLLDKWMSLRDIGISLERFFLERNILEILIYGAGDLGGHLCAELSKTSVVVRGYIDSNIVADEKNGIPIFSLDCSLPETDAIVITPVVEKRSIERALHKKCEFADIRILSLDDVVFM